MTKRLDDVTLIILIGSVLFLMLLGFIIVFLFQYQKRQSEHVRVTNEMSANFSRILLESQLEIRENTLNHISRELHDNLGQVAGLIKINLSAIDLASQDLAKMKLENSVELIKQLISDLRAISSSLGQDRINRIGLSKSIEIEIERLNNSGYINAIFIQTGYTFELDDSHEIIIFRILQELLNNAVKHSQASKIQVTITGKEAEVVLIVTDDGIGFHENGDTGSGGAGLTNIRYRAKLLNADLEIVSRIDAGTNITLVVPLISS